MSGWRVVRLEALPNRDGWIPIRAELGFRPAGINAWVGAEAGAEVIEDHDEADSGHEELYVVVAGHARFRIGTEELDTAELDAPAGTLVAVQPAARRSAVAVAPGTTILAVGARPGEAFSPSAWETESLAP
jgi:hypothetical protein